MQYQLFLISGVYIDTLAVCKVPTVTNLQHLNDEMLDCQNFLYLDRTQELWIGTTINYMCLCMFRYMQHITLVIVLLKCGTFPKYSTEI